MTTRNPRLAVTLDQATHATIAKLARLQKRSSSAIAADLLQEMTPALARITKLLEAAIANRATLPANTAAKLEGIESLLGGIATLSLDRIEEAVSAPPPQKTPAGRPARRRGH